MIAAAAGTLYVALELGQDKWLLACATQAAEKPRYRTLPARDLGRLADEIARAKERFRLPADAPVRTCYEAGGTASGCTGPCSTGASPTWSSIPAPLRWTGAGSGSSPTRSMRPSC